MAVNNSTSQYWQETLEGFGVASPVIIDKSNAETPVRSSGNFESVHIELSDPQIEKIESFVERNDLNRKTLLHGLWALLVFRYGAGDEVVYGCVDGGTAKTPVPVRVKISSSVAASSWLHELESYLKEVSQYFEIPFDAIHELSGFEEDMPVFMSAIDLSEETFDASGFAKMGCPLVFKPDLRSTAGELSLYFDPSYFKRDTLKRMLGHIDMLLSGILGNEQACVANIAMLTTAEFNQIVYSWNQTQTDYPSATCLHQLFEEQVEQDPDAVALIFRDQHLTYAELNQHANQLAHYLISLGVGPDRLVGVCMERSLEMSIALLAVLKAGGAYVPFDPDFPESRLAFMLEDTQAEVVLTQAHLQGRISSEKTKILCLDDDTKDWAHQETTNPKPALDAGNLFNVIFTSGSTGKPKGVMVPHRGIINRLQWMQDAYPLDTDDKVLQKTPYSFDVSVWELFWPLMTGAKLVYAEPEGHKDPGYLRDLIIEQGISTLHFVPSMLNVFLQIPDLELCTSVSRVFCSGEALQTEQERTFFVRLRNAQLHNLYGPTEASVDVSYFACQPDSQYSTVPIGRPVANTQLHILDANLNPLPLGVSGELYIGGVQLARGYLNRDDLTQSTFVENPYFEEGHPSKRLYKTGDQARYLPDGNIEFLGRLDSQVKIRGLRIELGEIEAALNESDTVETAVVVTYESQPGHKRIAAYIVPDLKQLEHAQEESRVSQIEAIFDETYRQEEATDDEELNIIGWNSSYTGELIAEDEMRQWINAISSRVLEHKLEKVLEIGCGTGMVLFKVAPFTQEYVGTDLSAVAIRQLKSKLESPEYDLPHVRLLVGGADNFADLDKQHFDTVIINSVVQLFPNVDYLVSVVEGAVKATSAGGRIVLGDIRSHPLLETFHASVECFKADAETTVEQLRYRIGRQVDYENELLIEPKFFFALKGLIPRISGVEVRVKRGKTHNELTRFRYDVILHVESQHVDPLASDSLDWQAAKFSAEQVKDYLVEHQPKSLCIHGVNNARLTPACLHNETLQTFASKATLSDLREHLSPLNTVAVDPEDLFTIGDAMSYDVAISPSIDVLSQINVVFRHRDEGDATASESQAASLMPVPDYQFETEINVQEFASNPVRGERLHKLLPELRESLKTVLPDYMIPSDFMLIKQIPVTSNGKLDRKALPAPELNIHQREDYRAAVNIIEETLVRIWSDVLGLDRVGVTDNFFELGGDSILSMQVVIRASKCQLDVTLSQLFQHNTIRELSKVVDWRGGAGTGGATNATEEGLEVIKRIDRSGPLELSSGQQQLWFLSRLESTSAAYVVTYSIRLLGSLDVGLLEKSLNRIIERHEILRTTYYDVDGKPYQAVSQPSLVRFPMSDLTKMASSERNAEVARIASVEAATPFDIAGEHCLRAQIVRLSKEEHVLLLSLHHIAFDGWSTRVLFGEIADYYTENQTGKEAIVPSLPIQYADYASWQRRCLETDDFRRQLDYWKTKLDGKLPVLELPIDRVRPSVQTSNGAWKTIEFDGNLTKSLKDLSRRNDCTLFMTLLAAYYVLLSRYSGQDDIIIGSPVANRKVEEVENLIGFFTNSVVLRIRPSSDPTFLQVLRFVRETTVEALANQDVPFGTLVEELSPERSLSHNPIYQVMFVLQNSPPPTCEFSGISMSSQEIDNAAARLDLALNMWEVENGLNGYFEFNSDLFDAEKIDRMVGHYEALLQSIVDDPNLEIDQFQILKEDEREQILYGWNQTQVAYPSFTGVNRLFEESVERHPESIALIFNDQHLTYTELNQRSNQLAHYLMSLGVGPDILVGVCLEGSLEMSIALLAILKAGGAYVPFDPDFPESRLAFMLDDTQAEFILTQDYLKERIPSGPRKILCLDSDGEIWAHQSTTNPRPALNADNLFNVIYTSGSTGRPKGVMVPHRGIINLLLLLKDAYRIDSTDRFLQKTPYSFDASVWELFLPLTTGARLIYAKPEGHKDPEYIRDIIVEQGITTLNLAPSMLGIFLNIPDLEQCVELRRVFCGGEALQTEHVRLFFERFSHTELHNQYGPTEASVLVTRFACQPNESYRSVPIGRPTPNNQLYILDTHLNPVPMGVTGELYIGGVQLARGYLNQQELTQRTFIENPYYGEGHSSKRLYKTGDRARHLSDGNIEFMGRMDFQVKLHGLRIELGEIEFHLNRAEGVVSSLVIVREDRPGDRKLVAYLAADKETAIPTHAELRRLLQEHLPHHMTPNAFVMLDEFPLTVNGKIDRKALPAPESDPSSLNADIVPPRNRVEQQLADTWCKVLGLERVGIEDSFFELGGDSITSIQIIVRARKQGIHITPKQMFQYPTISELAVLADEVTVLKSAKSTVTGCVPMTPIQQWFHSLNLSHPALWNQSYLFEVPSDLDVQRLEEAINAIIEHHDALRMRIDMDPSSVRQFDLETTVAVPLKEYDLEKCSDDERDGELRRLMHRHQARVDPQQGKNVQVVYFNYGARESGRVFVSVHHLVIDTASWSFLLRDIESAYTQLKEGRPLELPGKTSSYREWALALAAYAGSDELGEEIDYWTRLKGIEGGRIPLDDASHENVTSSTCVTSVWLGALETGQLLGETGSTYNTTVEDLLLTALVQTVVPWTGNRGLFLEIEDQGRETLLETLDLSRTVGWFTSLYGIELQVAPESSHGDAIKSIKEQLRALPHRGMGYGLLKYLSPDKDVRALLSKVPQAEVLFHYSERPRSHDEEHGLLRVIYGATEELDRPEERRRHVLRVNAGVIDDRLRIDFEYSKNLHEERTIGALANDYLRRLEEIIRHCLSPEAGGFTPSDFPEANLNQDDLDDLMDGLSD